MFGLPGGAAAVCRRIGDMAEREACSKLTCRRSSTQRRGAVSLAGDHRSRHCLGADGVEVTIVGSLSGARPKRVHHSRAGWPLPAYLVGAVAGPCSSAGSPIGWGGRSCSPWCCLPDLTVACGLSWDFWSLRYSAC
jgi:hypothetical protein